MRKILQYFLLDWLILFKVRIAACIVLLKPFPLKAFINKDFFYLVIYMIIILRSKITIAVICHFNSCNASLPSKQKHCLSN